MSRVAYYPGCSLHGTARELDSSFVGTAARLGVDLVEFPGWECCGNTAAHATNRLLATALPANEMAKVKDDMGLERVAVPCAACFARFMATNHDVEDDDTARDVAKVVGRPYTGGVGVLNLVDFYHDEVGLEALKAKVSRPFAGLKVAAYYGCLLTRPPKITLAEDPEYPSHMDEVLETLGCEPVQWTYKTDCCGASLALCEQAVVVELVRKIVANARTCGAQAIACACPLCQVNLDSRQGDIKKADPAWREVPIVYLSQFVGRAIGVGAADSVSRSTWWPSRRCWRRSRRPITAAGRTIGRPCDLPASHAVPAAWYRYGACPERRARRPRGACMREIMIEAITMAWFVRLPEGRPAETRPATEAGLAELTQRRFPSDAQRWARSPCARHPTCRQRAL